MHEDEELRRLQGPWLVEFNPQRGWTTQCERCDAPLVLEAGLYPAVNATPEQMLSGGLDWKYQGAVCDGCADEIWPERFAELVAARDRHLEERPFDQR